MRCYICDSRDDNISIDPRDGKTRPCFVCQGIILDAIETDPEDDEFIVDDGFDNGC